MTTTIELGNRVRDVVTGFTGIATACINYLNGCKQYCVVPPVGADGKSVTGEYFDHQRLVLVDEGIVARTSDTGGQQRDAPPRGG